MESEDKNRISEYEIVQNEQEKLTELGKLQYIQDKNKNNFNKLFQELSEIINEIDIETPEISYKKCDTEEINKFFNKEELNKISQPLNYSLKFDNKLFLQLLIFNKMSQHIIYSNQIEAEQNKEHVEDLQEQSDQYLKEIDELEKKVNTITNEKNKRILKLREKCKNRNKSITNYRILVLFLIYTSVYSFEHFYNICYTFSSEYLYFILNFIIINLTYVVENIFYILNEYNLGFVIIGILISVIYNKVFG